MGHLNAALQAIFLQVIYLMSVTSEARPTAYFQRILIDHVVFESIKLSFKSAQRLDKTVFLEVLGSLMPLPNFGDSNLFENMCHISVIFHILKIW